MEDPPELLQWARDTLNGITALRGKARRHEIELSDEAHSLLVEVGAELERLVDRNRSNDPSNWTR
jgi:hypothetical protein